MWEDPIVEEVRKARREIAARYPTAQAYYRHLIRTQRRFADRVVRKPAAEQPADEGRPSHK